MKYSLADYILTIKPNDVSLQNVFKELSLGGEGSVTDSIRLSYSNSLFETESYPTGGWVHNKNISRAGTASININQLSNNVGLLKQLVNMYYSGDYDGLTMTLTDSEGVLIAQANDCFPQQIPEQEFTSKAAMQTWTFTCGKISF